MRWPVVYAAAPLLAVGVALGLAAMVAEEGGKREVAGVEEEPASGLQRPAGDEPPAADEAPASNEPPLRKTTARSPQDAPGAAPAPADRPVAASSPARDSTEQEADGYIDPDAPAVEDAAVHHVGARRDPDAPSAVTGEEAAHHVGELLDPDAP